MTDHTPTSHYDQLFPPTPAELEAAYIEHLKLNSVTPTMSYYRHDDTPTISEEADRSGECATCGGQAPRLYSWEEEMICELCMEDYRNDE